MRNGFRPTPDVVPLGAPAADDGRALALDVLVERAERVEERVRVGLLVAEAEERHRLAAQLHGVEVRDERFPVVLEVALVPGRRAEDEHVILLEVLFTRPADVVQSNGLAAQLAPDQLGDAPRVAARAAVEDADPVHGRVPCAMTRLHQATSLASSGPFGADHCVNRWTRPNVPTTCMLRAIPVDFAPRRV